MRYYEEEKTERRNRRTAIMLTVAIYFLFFTGVVFASHPHLLPEIVKEWLKIESADGQENIKKELPVQQQVTKKEKA